MLRPQILIAFMVMATGLIASDMCVAEKRALVIGISNYRSLPSLGGPVNDIKIMRDVLSGWYGYRSITVLKDGQATMKAMEEGINRLQSANPSDEVVIYFSGHGTLSYRGSIIEDAIVPFDGDPDKIDTLITSRQLRDMLNKISARQVDVILDCCYSGGFTRSIKGMQYPPKCVTARNMPADAVRVIERTLVVTKPGHIVISASQTGRDVPDTEFPLIDGTRLRCSALAFCMYNSIHRRPDSSHMQALKMITEQLSKWSIAQQPSVGGIVSKDTLLFGGSVLHKTNSIPIIGYSTSGINLMAGSALGVSIGDTVSLWGTQSRKIGTVKVTKQDQFRSKISALGKKGAVAVTTNRIRP